MKNGFSYLLILLSLFSCNDEGKEMDVFRAEVYKELEVELETYLVEQSWSGANKYRERNERSNFDGLEDYHEKLDKLLDYFNTCKNNLMDSVQLREFEYNYLTLIYNYNSPKGPYFYPKNGQDLSSMNPNDTANYLKNNLLLAIILNTSLSEEIRQLHLIQLICKGLEISENRLPADGFHFEPIELLANSPQKIWKKGEKGFLIAGHYETGDRGYARVKIGNRIFDEESIIIRAPLEKGFHEIEGAVILKERGVEVEKPFVYRIWVE